VSASRPLVGVLCSNEFAQRPIQSVATRFLAPLHAVADVTALLVPADPDTTRTDELAAVLDGVLLTGSRSHVAPGCYGEPDRDGDPVDPGRDHVALALAARMVALGKPVFGICRGLQEINVLFGGTLSRDGCGGRHHRGEHDGEDYEARFGHRHAIDLVAGGLLATASGLRRAIVNSVHHQCIDRLGAGLVVEARSCGDALVEAIRAPGCGAEVLGVQWHPECDGADPVSHAFFDALGRAARTSRAGGRVDAVARLRPDAYARFRHDRHHDRRDQPEEPWAAQR
jgi:putative glutamine amidotransferase